jgi:hypothetical protein
MGNLFNDLSTNLARFIYAWIVPSAAAVAVFVLLVLPDIPTWDTSSHGSSVRAIGAFALAVLLLSVAFAYAAVPLFRVLEGYVMPKTLQRRLLKRRLREWHRLAARIERPCGTAVEYGLLIERRMQYPSSPDLLLPTRLGNALRATERYGTERFDLDTQTLWYELNSVAPETLRRDIEDARAGVDFFVSAIAHLALLAAVSATVAIATQGRSSTLVALVAAALIPLAYKQAVTNVRELRVAVQALVNIGRAALPSVLGFDLPDKFAEERQLWTSYQRVVLYGDDDENLGEELVGLDNYRISSAAAGKFREAKRKAKADAT